MPADKPNVLLIHADQHRWDCLGATGHPDVRTPNIDRLAADGVRYENAFCPYPICTPSRYSLLTGLYVRQHMGWSNHCTIPPELPTWPKLLRSAGYRTAAVGKMHFTPTYLDVGFDEMRLVEQDGPGRFDDDYHRDLRARGLVDRIDIMDQRHEYRRHAPDEYWACCGAAESDLPEEHHSTTWTAERACEVVSGWRGGGNCLMVGFIKPHHPFDPPAPWSRMYAPDHLTLPPGWTEATGEADTDFYAGYFPNAELTEASLRRVLAMYYATVSQIDHHVGRLIKLLEDAGLYDDTLIVYTSDHGDFLGFHHMILKGGPMYDPLIRLPLIVKYPGGPDAGAVSDALTSNVDMAPTLLGACGLEPAPTMAGLDLAAHPEGREWVFAEDRRGRCLMARSRTHKLLADRDQQHSRFYDLQADPLEMDNLLQGEPPDDVLDEACAQLADWAMHEAVPPVYVDEAAPIASADNALTLADGHREAMAEYFAEQMTRLRPTDADLYT